MKKYRFIKAFGNISDTSVYNEEGRYVGNIFGDEIDDGEVHKLMLGMIIYKDFFKDYIEEYIEEIKEEPKPKFKIGDPVTFYNDDNKIYGFIAGFDTFSNEYKISTDTRWYKEDELTLTKEEDIKKYFKQ